MPSGQTLFESAVTAHIEWIEVSLFQDRDGLTDSFSFVYAAGVTHECCTGCTLWEAIVVFATDLDEEGVDLLFLFLFGHLTLPIAARSTAIRLRKNLSTFPTASSEKLHIVFWPKRKDSMPFDMQFTSDEVDFIGSGILAGTFIQTPDGDRRAEDLCAGDLVITADSGPLPLTSVFLSRHICSGNAAPVVIGENTLGANDRIIVAPGQRVLMSSPTAEQMFGAREVLITATACCSYIAHRSDHERELVSYVHLVMNRREVLSAQGVQFEATSPEQIIIPGLDNTGTPREPLRLSLDDEEAVTLLGAVF